MEHRPDLPGDTRRNYADISRAQERLGWRPRTTLTDGLKRTVAWFTESEACELGAA